MLPHWTQGDALVGEVRLHYYRTGHGEKPPIVLVHGFSDNGLCWSRTARDLEAEFDVVMPDMHGHGLSERLRPGDELDMAVELAGLIRTLGLGRPIVCGHSMGAMVTFELGVRFPELASALILEDPPWWLERPGRHDRPTGDWAKGLADRTEAELAAECRADHPNWPEELIGAWAGSKKQLDPGVVDPLMEKVNRVATDWQSALRGLTQPTLILTGNPALGGIVTPEASARIRELNPRATLVNVPNVGHLIRFDNYAAFMAALRGFLRDVEAAP